MERSIPFYSALFGTEPAKVRPGYAMPDGTPWEVFAVKADSEEGGEASVACCVA